MYITNIKTLATIIRPYFFMIKNRGGDNMPKNPNDIVYGTNYHKSIDKGDEVTTVVHGLYRGEKCKVIGYAPISIGYFKTLLVQTDKGINFYVAQNFLRYWEDYTSIKNLN